MRPGYLCRLIAICIACGLSCFAQSADPFLPITPQDLAIKDVPGNPNSPAIQLYYSYYRDDDKNFESSYKRIKVLNEAGKQYADVEIPLDPGDTLKELAARTIHPDGSIVPFTGKPFEKTRIKGRGFKYLADTFSLPDVTVGSIIEYSYALKMGKIKQARMTEWPIQGELYAVRERFRLQPHRNYVPRSMYAAPATMNAPVSCSYQNQRGAFLPRTGPNGLMELEVKNMAPFLAEEFMPPETDYRASVLCYSGAGIFSDLIWNILQMQLTQGTDKFIGNPSAFRAAAAQAIGSENDPEAKLRKLYAFAQRLRNISYERERTAKEEKAENIKQANSAAEVMRHGYGDSWEINTLFTGLSRAAGYEASMVLINDRYQRTFNKYILWLGQLSGSAVLVDVDGRSMILDPGTRFCPFGALPPRYSESTAMVLKKAGGFLTTQHPALSSINRSTSLVLAPDGSAKGEMTVELSGPRALEERLDVIDADEAGRRKDLEDVLSAWLPAGSVTRMLESSGWESSEEPLKAKFSVELPSFAATSGKRLIAPAYFLTPLRRGIFASELRSYPISFESPFADTDELTLQLPEGWSLEEPPYRRKAQLPWGSYEFSVTDQGNKLLIHRELTLERALFPQSDYTQLKYLFGVVQAGDSSQAVLQAKQTAASTGTAK